MLHITELALLANCALRELGQETAHRQMTIMYSK